MSKALYLYQPGEKPLKLKFTVDDLIVLKQYYEYIFKDDPGVPDFNNLELLMINYFAGLTSFKIYWLAYKYCKFKAAIKSVFIKNISKIKNFSLWKADANNN